MSKLNINWIRAEKEPGTPIKASEVSKESEMLLISCNNGIVPGFFVRFTQDYNGFKKYDGVFCDTHYNVLQNPSDYYELKNIDRPGEQTEHKPKHAQKTH